MKLKSPVARVLPNELFQTVASLRSTAEDVRVNASGRVVAISRLMQIENYPIERYWNPDTVDDYIESKIELPPPEHRPTSVKVVRQSARNQAIADIRAALREDVESGRIYSLSQLPKHLRFVQEPPTAPLPDGTSLSEQHRDELVNVLDMMRQR